jgi:hypothetical protein
MNLKIKAIGLAFAAALVASAVITSGASSTTGGHFTSEVEHTLVTGKEAGTHATEFEVFGIPITCTTVAYEGTIKRATKTATEITITPNYKNCFQKTNHIPENAVTIDIKGCAYILTVRPNPATNDNTVHVECPLVDGKRTTITITAPGCEITIPPQTPTGGVVYKSFTGTNGKPSITLEATVTDIVYEKHGACEFLVPFGTGPFGHAENVHPGTITVDTSATGGILRGSVTVEGFALPPITPTGIFAT